jgi:hypothetical protein
MYYLTSFGKVVYESRQLVGVGVKDYWKLRAIDILRLELPTREYNKIIETLVEDLYIRKLLLRHGSSNTIQNHQKNDT